MPMVPEASQKPQDRTYDQPYKFGRLPSAEATYPFSTREFARLLVLRGAVREGEFGTDDVSPQVLQAQWHRGTEDWAPREGSR